MRNLTAAQEKAREAITSALAGLDYREMVPVIMAALDAQSNRLHETQTRAVVQRLQKAASVRISN